MQIYTYEQTARGRACAEELLERAGELGARELVLLPIPSVGERTEAAVRERLGGGVIFAGYGLPPNTRERIESVGGRAIDSGEDESFLLENARLTAKGMTELLRAEGEQALLGKRVGIVGYGRIGRALLDLLEAEGARVEVISGSERKRAELENRGVLAVPPEEAELASLDILINTSPRQMIFGARLPSLRAIDLSSGKNLPWEEVERYPALPAKAFPRESGKVWARSVIRALGGEK